MAWILGTSPQLALNLLNGKLEKLSNLPNLPEMDLQLQLAGEGTFVSLETNQLTKRMVGIYVFRESQMHICLVL